MLSFMLIPPPLYIEINMSYLKYKMTFDKKRINKLRIGGVVMENLRYLPAVHQLQAHPRFTQMVTDHHMSADVLTTWLNDQIDRVRHKIKNDELRDKPINREILTEMTLDLLEERVGAFFDDNLRHVINATGVVLHTNLGRACLSEQAVEQIARTASSYSTLEYNITTGKRGSRHDIVEEYIKQLTGTEAAMVVNNNAAAVYLVLKALAAHAEVIVSRGELVEIGGSFRISEIMQESEAELIGVGTTNKTYVSDYEQAITEETALLMKVHKSNFKIVGFSADVDTEELVDIAAKHDVPIYEDLGSGTLFDFKKRNIGMEPTVQEKVKAGIDIISFSGDKLLGGPQAGIIVGKKEFINQLKQHQLARVLRVDKFTLAGLEATLKAYVRGREQQEIPTIRDILKTSESVLEDANTFVERVNGNSGFTCQVAYDTSKIGGGTMPDVEIATHIVNVTHSIYSSTVLAEKLRKLKIPIIVRVKNEAVLLDFRTVHETQLDIVVEAFLQME